GVGVEEVFVELLEVLELALQRLEPSALAVGKEVIDRGGDLGLELLALDLVGPLVDPLVDGDVDVDVDVDIQVEIVVLPDLELEGGGGVSGDHSGAGSPTPD